MKWNLQSLSRQNIPAAFETIVLNDGLPDDTEALCRQYKQQLNLKYVFTGQRNLAGKMVYRVPGFALNIGAKLSSGKVLIISCAEMFHLNNTIMELYNPLLVNSKLLSTSIGMDDDGSFLNYLVKNKGAFDSNAYYNNYPRLRTELPFLMAFSRREFFAIGGYDEDFVGFAYDDDDLVSRLVQNGCRHCLSQAATIHLYHPRHDNDHTESPEYLHNKRLYSERKNQITRNRGREWGVLLTPHSSY